MASNSDIVSYGLSLLQDCDSDVADLLLEEIRTCASAGELRDIAVELIKQGSEFAAATVDAALQRDTDQNPLTHTWLLNALIEADKPDMVVLVLGDYLLSRSTLQHADLDADSAEAFLGNVGDFLDDALDRGAWNVLRGVRALDKSLVSAFSERMHVRDTRDIIAASHESVSSVLRLLAYVVHADVFYTALRLNDSLDLSSEATAFAVNAGDAEASALVLQMVACDDYRSLRRISRLVGVLSRESQERLFKAVVDLDCGPMMAALLENADWKTPLERGIQYATRSKNALREVYDVYPIQTLRAIGGCPDFAVLATAVGPEATETIETCTRVSVFVYFAEQLLTRREGLHGPIARFHSRVRCSRRIALEFMVTLGSPVAAAYLEWDRFTIAPELDVQDVLSALRVPEIAYEVLKNSTLRRFIREHASAFEGADLEQSTQNAITVLIGRSPWSQEHLKTVGSQL